MRIPHLPFGEFTPVVRLFATRGQLCQGLCKCPCVRVYGFSIRIVDLGCNKGLTTLEKSFNGSASSANHCSHSENSSLGQSSIWDASQLSDLGFFGRFHGSREVRPIDLAATQPP